MRLISWPGVTALACAAGGGFLAGEAVHRHDPAVIQVCDTGGELCEAPPSRLSPPQLVEEIDLTCPPTLADAFGPQSVEPPLADVAPDPIRIVNFEVPAGSPAGPAAPFVMPYLTDDGTPALLPPLGDVPLLTPVPVTPPTSDANNPIYQAVKKFVGSSVKPSEVAEEEQLRISAQINQLENERQVRADWLRIWAPQPSSPNANVTGKVQLGKPPVSEHPSAVNSEKPSTPPPPKADTTEIRPGDLPSKPNGD